MHNFQIHLTFFSYTTTIIVVAPASVKAMFPKVQKILLQRNIVFEIYIEQI